MITVPCFSYKRKESILLAFVFLLPLFTFVSGSFICGFVMEAVLRYRFFFYAYYLIHVLHPFSKKSKIKVKIPSYLHAFCFR